MSWPISEMPPNLPPSFPLHRVQPTKGRGAVSNLQGRFQRDQREAFDDGWSGTVDEVASTGDVSDVSEVSGAGPALPPKLVTQVTMEQARSILTRNASPDIPFDTSLNPYRGCEHVMRHCIVFTDCSTLNLGLEVY